MRDSACQLSRAHEILQPVLSIGSPVKAVTAPDAVADRQARIAAIVTNRPLLIAEQRDHLVVLLRPVQVSETTKAEAVA